MSFLIGQTVSDKPKVNGGAPPVGEVLLTCVLVIVAILWSLDGSPEETYEHVPAVAGAPAAAVMPSHSVTTSALAAPPKAAPRIHPARPAPVTQQTKLADGNAVTETKPKNPIARVAAVFRHLNPRGRKKTSVVKTTTPE
jgi:hypothetical protein